MRGNNANKSSDGEFWARLFPLDAVLACYLRHVEDESTSPPETSFGNVVSRRSPLYRSLLTPYTLLPSARHDISAAASLQTCAEHHPTPKRRVAMSSQLPAIPSKSAASTSKAVPPSGQSSPAGSQTQLFSNDSGQRRSGSSSSNARSSSAARNQQSSKPKHKQGKKFRPLDEDAEAELFSMQNPHGRKGQTSITHLMNFSLPPRPHQNQFHRHNFNGPRRGGRVNPSWGLGSGYHSVDKARSVKELKWAEQELTAADIYTRTTASSSIQEATTTLKLKMLMCIWTGIMSCRSSLLQRRKPLLARYVSVNQRPLEWRNVGISSVCHV